MRLPPEGQCRRLERFPGCDMPGFDPEQAKPVKRIYGMSLQGQPPFRPARKLTEEAFPFPAAGTAGTPAASSMSP